jgi:uncharacterized protein (TIGR03437 family)
MEVMVKTLLFLVTAGLAVAQTPTAVALVNPGFEAPYEAVNATVTTIAGQIANGWEDNSSWANSTLQYSQETTNPHSGASCQKIVAANGTVELVQRFQLLAGNLYTASVWMRGVPGTIGKLFVEKDGSPYTNYFSTDVVLTSAWQQVSAQGYIATTEPGILILSADSPATFWVDDAAVSYIPGTIGPAPNPGPISPSFFGMHLDDFAYNPLRNGGFEPPYDSVGINNKISGYVAMDWVEASASYDVTVAYSQDTNNPHSGTSSQKISVSAVNSGGATLIQRVGVLPGANYTLTAWVRGDPGTKLYLTLTQWGTPYTEYIRIPVNPTSDWQQVSKTGQVNDTGMMTAAILVESPGTVWVDDLSVTDALGQPIAGEVPWPAVGFGTLRLWGTPTTWHDLEPAKGAWNWEPLDGLVTAAEAHGVSDILLTLGQTPNWASSDPDAGNTTLLGSGAPAPPADIQDWRDYITAVAQRYKGRIRYYEIWNEPDASYYTGTVAQLVTLTQEAYKILKAVDPGNTVLSPAVGTDPGYLDMLLAAGEGNSIDMVAYHHYTLTDPPESAGQTVANIRLLMAKYGLAKVPLWITEGGSGDDTTPADVAPTIIPRRFLTELAFGSVRYDWYVWDPASEWCVGTVENDPRVLTPAARAYGFVYGWLAGSTLTQALIDAAGNWQVWLTRPDGSQALVIWNPSLTTQFKLPGTFAASSSHDLSGGVQSVTGATVTVTDSPILLTTSADAPATISSVNVAGGGPDIAQNTWIEIHGKNLVPANTPASGMIWSAAPEFASNVMPTQLGNLPLQVTVNNIPAYLYFFCSGAAGSVCATDQINVLTPMDGTVGPVQVAVYNGIYSASFTVSMQAAAPSFPLVGATKYLVATHADYSLVGPASMSVPGYPFTPAQAGETIVIYAFGFGMPESAVVSGSASQSGSLPTLPAIRIGGTAATVVYAGVISPGLYQLNVVVPSTAPSGDNPVTCSYNGATSPPGDLIAVR